MVGEEALMLLGEEAWLAQAKRRLRQPYDGSSCRAPALLPWRWPRPPLPCPSERSNRCRQLQVAEVG